MYEYETSILSGLFMSQFYGLVLNWGFQGVLTTQVYIYHLNSSHDSRILRATVYLVCVYEWVQTGLLTANLAVCSQAFFKPHPLIDLIGSFDNSSLWLCIFLMSAIISAAVQIFYAWRLYKLIGSPWVPGIIIMICLAQLSAGLASSANLKLLSRSLIETEYNDLIYDTATIAWLAGSALADVVIAVSMIICLQRLKRGFGTVNVILNRLITLVVETGGLTAGVAVLSLGLFLSPYPYAFCPLSVISKLYGNSLLMSLNNRVIVRRKMDAADVAVPLREHVTSCSQSGSLSINVSPLRTPVVVAVLQDVTTSADSHTQPEHGHNKTSLTN